MRIVTRFLSVALWLGVLFAPTIFLSLYLWKKHFFSQNILLSFIAFSCLGGTTFSLLIQGLNSDQFITNLIPLINVSVLFMIIGGLTQSSKKLIPILTITGLSLFNIYFVSINQWQRKVNPSDLYDETFLQSIQQELKKVENPRIAYVISDSLAQEHPPIIWYTFLPCKVLSSMDCSRFINLNYPYHKYDRNTASLAYSAENQMKYYLNDSSITLATFKVQQCNFIREHQIEYLVSDTDRNISYELSKLVTKKILNSKNGDVFYVLNPQ